MKTTISIVTVTYNCISVIEETIKSVIEQDFNGIEYIIIDGCSNDGTLELLNKYKNHFSYMISEPDQGIYDAMNKAINIATGEWILFLNAGDKFANNHVLNNIFSDKSLDNYTVLYGNTIYKNASEEHKMNGTFFKANDMHLPFCHQSSLVKTKIMKDYKFDLKYKVAADYNFFYNLYIQNKPFKYLNTTISVYDTEGFSSKRVIQCYKEVAKINHTYNSFDYHFNIMFLSLRNLCLQLLPNKLIIKIRRFKRFTHVDKSQHY